MCHHSIIMGLLQYSCRHFHQLKKKQNGPLSCQCRNVSAALQQTGTFQQVAKWYRHNLDRHNMSPNKHALAFRFGRVSAMAEELLHWTWYHHPFKATKLRPDYVVAFFQDLSKTILITWQESKARLSFSSLDKVTIKHFSLKRINLRGSHPA